MMNKRGLRILIIVLISLANIGVDQISKYIVRQNVEYHEQISVVGKYMTLTKIENTGAFLGMGDNLPPLTYKLLMIAMPLIVIGLALFYLIKKNNLSKLLIVGISLFIGGGLGNIIDRVLYGSVTDFLFFDFVIFHTGIVNLADISVTAGFFVVLYDMYITQRKSKIKPNKA